MNHPPISQLRTGVWARHYWFAALTMCLSYPRNPTEHIRRQFYDLHQNLFLFIPENEDIRPYYSYIEKYPITPYLDSRDSLLQWLFFVRRQIDESVGNKYMGVDYLMAEYDAEYVLKDDSDYRNYTLKRIVAGIGIVVVLGMIARRTH